MNRRCRFRSKRRDEKGQVFIEFALVLPILVFIIMGGMVFGLIVNAKQVASGASREAARKYSTTADAAAARRVATEYLRGSLIADSALIDCEAPDNKCAVTIDEMKDGGNDYVKATVNYRQNTVVGGILGLPAEVTQSGSAVFRMAPK